MHITFSDVLQLAAAMIHQKCWIEYRAKLNKNLQCWASVWYQGIISHVQHTSVKGERERERI